MIHDQLVDYVSDLLTDWNWTVDRDRYVGTVRPDLVAKAEDGTAYVIEIKTGDDAAHLGTVGQLETFKNALEAELGREPDALLLLADEAPDELKKVADDVGVTMVEGFHDDQSALLGLLKQLLATPSDSAKNDAASAAADGEQERGPRA